MRWLLVLLASCAVLAQEPAVMGVTLGMPRAEVERRLARREIEFSTREEIAYKGGPTVEFDPAGRVGRVEGKSVLLPRWMSSVEVGPASASSRLRTLLGNPQNAQGFWAYWRLPDGITLSGGPEPEWYKSWQGTLKVAMDAMSSYRLERWLNFPPPQVVTVEGIALGASRGEVDASQALRGLTRHAIDGGAWYTKWGRDGPSAWFAAAGRCTGVRGLTLEIDGYAFTLGSEAQLLSLLGRPDGISPDEMFTEWSYARYHLRATFLGTTCFGFKLGEAR